MFPALETSWAFMDAFPWSGFARSLPLVAIKLNLRPTGCIDSNPDFANEEPIYVE